MMIHIPEPPNAHVSRVQCTLRRITYHVSCVCILVLVGVDMLTVVVVDVDVDGSAVYFF